MIIAIFALVGLCSKFEDSAKDLAWIEDPEVTNQVLTKPRAILYFDLNGPIIESALPNDDYSKFTRMLDAKLNNRNVNDILSIEKTLHNAAYNKTIKALYFNLSGLSGTTLSVAKRVIAAINQFKAVNKDADVIAYADNYSASAYAIASACKTIVLNPFGSFTFKVIFPKTAIGNKSLGPTCSKVGLFCNNKTIFELCLPSAKSKAAIEFLRPTSILKSLFGIGVIPRTAMAGKIP